MKASTWYPIFCPDKTDDLCLPLCFVARQSPLEEGSTRKTKEMILHPALSFVLSRPFFRRNVKCFLTITSHERGSVLIKAIGTVPTDTTLSKLNKEN